MSDTKTFTMYTANVTQAQKNTKYPNRVIIKSFEDLAKATTFDNTCSLFSESKRSVKNYITADAFAMDIDNTHTENKAFWVTLQDVKDALPGVAFYYVFSRNHLKEKVKGDGTVQAPREKMHVYFPLSADCPKIHQDKLQTLINATGSLFPYFDAAAADTARFFYGVPHEAGSECGGYVTGEYCINDYITALEKKGMLNTAITLALAKAEGKAIQDHGANWKENPSKPFHDLALWQERAAAITGERTGSSSKKEYEHSINTTGVYPEIINIQQKGLANKFKLFAKKHDIYYEEKIEGSFIYFYVKCPWENLHTTPDEGLQATVQIKALDNGGAFYSYNCWHEHCQEKKWEDYKNFYEPPKDNAIAEAVEMAEPEPVDYLESFLDKVTSDTFRPYQTGVTWFDNLVGGGLLKQSLCIFMGASGAGKTTLCQQIVEAIAANKKECVYLNLEMSREQMLAKTFSTRLARKGKLYTAAQILQGYAWNDQQRAEITEEIENYSTEIYPYLKYNPAETSTDLDAIRKYLNKIGKAAKDSGQDAPIIVIDYLHLITTTQKLDNQELIKQIVVCLKKYALTYNSIVIAIAATGREANKGGRVTLNSGRDSSNLEYTCDYAFGLNYNAVVKKEVNPEDSDEMGKLQQAEPREMVLQVLKARLGEQGAKQDLYYNARYNFFYADDEFAPTDNSPFYKPKLKPRGRS